MKSLESEYIFVYGTLKQRFSNEFALYLRSQTEFIADSFCFGELYLIDWFPGLVLNKNKTSKVFGELYKSNNIEELLSELDGYEEIESNIYERKIIHVYTKNCTFNAWVYIYNQDITLKHRLESGVF